MPVIEPDDSEGTPTRMIATDIEDESECNIRRTYDGAIEIEAESSHTLTTTGALESNLQISPERSNMTALQHDNDFVTPRELYRRLSVPPSCILDPPKAFARPLPTIPQKGSLTDTSYQPHPVYPVDEWEVRTPSPVKSVRDGISTPPLCRRRGFTPTALLNVITTSWKRRVTSNSENSNEGRSQTTSRSAS
jgi:hypothetical protein